MTRHGLSQDAGILLLGSDFKALGVARSLGRRGIRVAIVDSLPRSAWFSRYVGKRFRWHGPMSGPAFLDFVLSLPERHELEGSVLLPMQDEAVELVSRNLTALSRHYRVATQGWEVVSRAHDKRLLNTVADEAGVDIPRTWYPADDVALASLPIVFPAIVKPSQSIWLQYGLGKKALPADTMPALLAQYRLAAGVVPAAELMVQEQIPGNGRTQFSVAAFCLEGAIHSAMTARRTRQFPIDYGLGSSFVEAIEVPELLPPAARLLQRLGLTGMVEVEFKRDPRDGRDKLLDVNVRPWGWHTLGAACGIDFPYLQYCLATERPLPKVAARYGYRWRRLMTDVPAAVQEMRAGMLTPMAYLASLGGRTVGSVADFTDPLPVVGDLGTACWRVLRRPRGGHPSGAATETQAFEVLAR